MRREGDELVDVSGVVGVLVLWKRERLVSGVLVAAEHDITMSWMVHHGSPSSAERRHRRGRRYSHTTRMT